MVSTPASQGAPSLLSIMVKTFPCGVTPVVPGVIFGFIPKPAVFSLPKSPSFLSALQKTLPAIEKQVHDALQQAKKELQKYTQSTHPTVSDKTIFLVGVSISIASVTKQRRPF